MPNHEIALELLKKSDCPIAAPSANKFGHVSPSKA
jgi:L-threonylcarbamoyladenylate synthase